MQFNKSILAIAVLAFSSQVVADDRADDDMEHLTIFGTEQVLNDVPGSAHRISQDEIEKFDFSDIMRTLTTIPGVYVLEEDGYGLRPNIGMRGTGQNRSEKVTILEDNVLAAPAPYAAPSAYYFPTSGRMQQIEVLKGTSSAMYGPRTTGGVVNLLSRQIPEQELAGAIKLSAGQDGFAKLHAYAGGQGDNVGGVAEVYRYQADGFKDINHSERETGFIKNDVMAKVKFNTDSTADYYQELEFKLKYADESSDETYMGLTETDYQQDAYSRYSASQLDNMSTEHKQFQVNHFIQLSNDLSLGTSAYYNDFSRNWYKVSKVGAWAKDETGNYIYDEDGNHVVNRKSLSGGGIELASAFDTNANDELLAVDIKANNRAYLSKGIQTVFDADFGDHQVKFGARYHEDEMDRFQWVDKYELNSQYNMTLATAGVPGTDSNRIDSAKALALYVHDEITLGDFIINAGLRYEDMTIERHDWGESDPARVASPSHKKNDVEVLLPSVAVTYKVNDELVLLAGVQEGFAPPAPGNEDSDNEESLNYELGARYTAGAFNGEVIYFFSDYDNMHGNCTASQGCEDDNIGNQYNAGEVEVMGVEVKAGFAFELESVRMPVTLTYTHTQSEFLNSFSSNLDVWGDVEAGDELPYVPENQLQLGVGVEGEKWGADMLVRYSNTMRISAGQGVVTAEEQIDSRTIVDIAAYYDLDNRQQVKLTIDNLLDKEYVTSKTHGSIMVGKPQSITLGYSYSF